MININNLVLLSDYPEEKKKNHIITEGIKGNIQLYIMDTQKSDYSALKRGDLQKIKSTSPKKVLIVLRPARLAQGNWQDFGHNQYCDIDDLWVDKIAADALIEKALEANKTLTFEETPLQTTDKNVRGLGDKERKTFLLIIAALVKCMAKEKPSILKNSGDIVVSEVARKISPLVENKDARAYPGLSETNLREKITEALTFFKTTFEK